MKEDKIDNASKKILILSSFPAPYRVDIFEGLAKEFHVDVFFGKCNDENRSKDWFASKEKFHYYILNNAEDSAYFKKCIYNIKDYDLVLAYDWYLKFAIKVELICILKNVPFIINCDGAFIKDTMSIKDFLKRYLVSHATGCFASGYNAKNYFLNYGAKKNKIFIHNFTSLHSSDLLERQVSRQEKSKLRKELGLKDCKTVLAIGQFIYRKGFDVLLNSWKRMDSATQLIIIGGGDLKGQYIKFIENYDLNNVIILDFKSKNEIFKYYKASDLFVLPTREDIWGLVINEAMACGLPVITTNRCIAGLELLNSQYIVPADDEEKLAIAMKNVLNSEKIQHDIGEYNLRLIKNYVIENVIESHINNIRKLLK